MSKLKNHNLLDGLTFLIAVKGFFSLKVISVISLYLFILLLAVINFWTMFWSNSMVIFVFLSLKHSLNRNNNKPSWMYTYIIIYVQIQQEISSSLRKRGLKERKNTARRTVKRKRFTADHLHISKKSMFHKKAFLPIYSL